MKRQTGNWLVKVTAAVGLACTALMMTAAAHAQAPNPGVLGGFGPSTAGAGGLGGLVAGTPGAANGPGLTPLFLPIGGGNAAPQMNSAEMAAMQMMMMAGMAGGYGGVKTGVYPGMMYPGMMGGGFSDTPDDEPQPAPKRRRHRAPREAKAKAKPAKAPAAARKKPRK